jgi:DNA-binding response OmpR family regulator
MSTLACWSSTTTEICGAQSRTILKINISKNNSDEVDRVIGLELGADDYLTVPFGLRELYARVRAILRRNLRRDDLKSIIYTFAGWQLRPRTRQLLNPQGVELPLTKLEYALLTAFVAAPRRVLNREHLISATRLSDNVFDRAVDVQVCRLRRKLEFDPNTPSIIKTERGGGYRFDTAVQQVAFRWSRLHGAEHATGDTLQSAFTVGRGQFGEAVIWAVVGAGLRPLAQAFPDEAFGLAVG